MADRSAIRTGFSCFLMQSEGELEPGGQRQPRRGFLHLLLRKGLGLVRCIINGSCHEVFEHFLVIRIARKKLRIDFNAPGFGLQVIVIFTAPAPASPVTSMLPSSA